MMEDLKETVAGLQLDATGQRETVEQRTRTQVSRTRERQGQNRERRCVLGLRQE